MGETGEAERISVPQLRRDLVRFTDDMFVLNHAEAVALVEAVEAEYRLGDYAAKDRLEARFDFSEAK